MAVRRNPVGQPAPMPAGQQVFKPRASVYKFQSYFPFIIAGLIALIALGAGGSYWLHTKWPALLPLWWMIPLFMALPAFSVIVGAVYASRLTQSRIIIDPDRLRILQGNVVQANLPWSQISRLTVRRERDDDVYEVWVRNQPFPLPAAFFEDSEKLLQAVSARTRRPWEREKPRP